MALCYPKPSTALKVPHCSSCFHPNLNRRGIRPISDHRRCARAQAMDLESLRNMEKGYNMQMKNAKSVVGFPQLLFFSLWCAPMVNCGVRHRCDLVVVEWPDLGYALQDDKAKLQARLAEIEERKKALKRGK